MSFRTMAIIAALALFAFFLSDGVIQLALLAIVILLIYIMIGEDKIKAFIAKMWGKAQTVAKDNLPQNVDEAVVVQDVTIASLGDKYQITVVTDKGEFLLKKQTFPTIPQVLSVDKVLRHKVVYTLNGNISLIREETLVTTDDDPRIFYCVDKEE